MSTVCTRCKEFWGGPGDVCPACRGVVSVPAPAVEPTRHELTLMQLIAQQLTEDLLKPEYRGSDNPMRGHCYVASEELFHVLGGKAAGYTPMFIHHEDSPHWFVRGPKGQILDITASQFATPVPYGQAKPKGFLTKDRSKRAEIVHHRVRAHVMQLKEIWGVTA